MLPCLDQNCTTLPYGGEHLSSNPQHQIGSYPVCTMWLKPSRGRALTYDDLEHYSKVVTALQETIRLMAAIDAAIPHWPLE